MTEEKKDDEIIAAPAAGFAPSRPRPSGSSAHDAGFAMDRAPVRGEQDIDFEHTFSRSSNKPSDKEQKLLDALSRKLLKAGNFKIRFVERLEEETYPSLLISVLLPNEIQPEDEEVFNLHEIAHQLSDLEEVDLLITTSSMSGRGRKLEYDSSELSISIGINLLTEVPDFQACETLLRESMLSLSENPAYSDIFDLLNNLKAAARVYFYLGHKAEAIQILDKQVEILNVLAERADEKSLKYSLVFPELNKSALLYAIFGEFEKSENLITLNFQRAWKFEKDYVSAKASKKEKRAALFSKQELISSEELMRSKIRGYEDKHQHANDECQQILEYANDPLKRFSEETSDDSF